MFHHIYSFIRLSALLFLELFNRGVLSLGTLIIVVDGVDLLQQQQNIHPRMGRTITEITNTINHSAGSQVPL